MEAQQVKHENKWITTQVYVFDTYRIDFNVFANSLHGAPQKSRARVFIHKAKLFFFTTTHYMSNFSISIVEINKIKPRGGNICGGISNSKFSQPRQNRNFLITRACWSTSRRGTDVEAYRPVRQLPGDIYVRWCACALRFSRIFTVVVAFLPENLKRS